MGAQVGMARTPASAGSRLSAGKTTLPRFDMGRLMATMDGERRARRWSWPELAAAINRPFAGTPSLPISSGTLRGLLDKHSVTSAVVLQILRWLTRAPEHFLTGPSRSAVVVLADPGPGRILRMDTGALFAALDAERGARQLPWTHVAAELPGFTPGMLTRLARGPLIGCPRVFLLTQWLRQPAAAFVRACDR